MKGALVWVLLLLSAARATAWEAGPNPERFRDVPSEFRRNAGAYPKTPFFFDCGPKRLVIHPGGIVLTNFSRIALMETNSPVRLTLEAIEAATDRFYLMVLVRPGAAETLRALYRAFYLRPIDVALELADAEASLADVTNRQDYTLCPMARPVRQAPLSLECRAGQLFYVPHHELFAEAQKVVERFRPMSRRQDVEAARRTLQQSRFADEQYELEGPVVLDGILRLRPVADAPLSPFGDVVGEGANRFLRWLREFDPRVLYVEFIVRDDSFDVARRARVVAEETGWEWRIRPVKTEEVLEFRVQPR
ncbi:MAG: hypothetical protein NZ483_04800 [Verrucomicrobiae bacterium]|nr:hypothetical protein [Verrucomicrobiae bacterium]MDW8343026.1 hypothetical protein [Verrucomicrobiae bacterium]